MFGGNLKTPIPIKGNYCVKETFRNRRSTNRRKRDAVARERVDILRACSNGARSLNHAGLSRMETARPRGGDPQKLRTQLGPSIVLSAGSLSVLRAGFTAIFSAITTF